MGVRYSRWILSKEGADRVRYGTSAVGKQGERWELVGGEVGRGMMSGYREGCGGVGWEEGSAQKWGFVVWVVADIWVGWGDISG